jgi:hypothetical protein
MPRYVAFAFALLLAACAAQPVPTPAPQAARPNVLPSSPFPDTQGGPLTAAQAEAARTYRALLRAAKADPAQMDWAALRQAYAASPVYNPAVGNNLSMRPVMAASAAGNYAEVAALCEAELARNWMNIPAHFYAAIAYNHLGNRPAASRNDLVVKAFIHGALSGHIGTSPEAAIPVLATIEEYMLLGFSRARFRKQSLVNLGGHFYDAMEYTRDPSPVPATMYFAIDAMFARESKIATGATLITEDQIPD